MELPTPDDFFPTDHDSTLTIQLASHERTEFRDIKITRQ